MFRAIRKSEYLKNLGQQNKSRLPAHLTTLDSVPLVKRDIHPVANVDAANCMAHHDGYMTPARHKNGTPSDREKHPSIEHGGYKNLETGHETNRDFPVWHDIL